MRYLRYNTRAPKIISGSTNGSKCNYKLSRMKSGKDIGNEEILRRWRKFGKDGRSWSRVVWKIIPNGWSIDWEGPATDGRQSDGRVLQTTGACMSGESDDRPGRSATRTSRLGYVGADPCKALYISTAILPCTLSGERSKWRLWRWAELTTQAERLR